MPTIHGQIQSTKYIKSGQGAKGPWTMFEVMVNGEKFTGFGDRWQKLVNAPAADYEFEERPWTDKQGNQHVGKTLKNPRSGGMQGLDQVLTKLDKILSILERQNGQPELDMSVPDMGPPPDEDINVDGIPF